MIAEFYKKPMYKLHDSGVLSFGIFYNFKVKLEFTKLWMHKKMTLHI